MPVQDLYNCSRTNHGHGMLDGLAFNPGYTGHVLQTRSLRQWALILSLKFRTDTWKRAAQGVGLGDLSTTSMGHGSDWPASWVRRIIEPISTTTFYIHRVFLGGRVYGGVGVYRVFLVRVGCSHPRTFFPEETISEVWTRGQSRVVGWIPASLLPVWCLISN